jgi:hypothetical protein
VLQPRTAQPGDDENPKMGRFNQLP